MSGRGQRTVQRRLTTSKKIGLAFPVSRIHRYLKKSLVRRRVSVGAAAYLTTVLEYLSCEVLELSGSAAKQLKRAIIKPRHLYLAIMNDNELKELLNNVTIPAGGVLPNIHPNLVQKPGSAGQTSGGGAAGGHTKKKTVTTVFKSKAKVPPSKKPSKQPSLTLTKSPSIGQKDPGTGLVILNEKILSAGPKLTVVQGDISKVPHVDAVVHPTNASFYKGGEVGSRLEQVGGPSYAQEVQALVSNLGTLKPLTCAVMATKSRLNAKYILHCNGPMWSASTSPIDDLKETIFNCFEEINQNQTKITSVAFPSVGSGRAGFPKQLAAETILRAIKEYFGGAANTSKSPLEQVYFILYDKESVDVYVSELERLTAGSS